MINELPIKKIKTKKITKIQANLNSKKHFDLMFWAREQGFRGLASYVTQHLEQLHEKLTKEGRLIKKSETLESE